MYVEMEKFPNHEQKQETHYIYYDFIFIVLMVVMLTK